VLRKQIARALRTLSGRVPSDQAVHGVRKELKKARAALRLLRTVLGDDVFVQENAALRDAARPLSPLRDGKALLIQLDSLIERYGEPARALGLEDLRRLLRRERLYARQRLLGNPMSLEPQVVALRRLHARSARWNVGQHGWSALGAGLERVYGKGRRAMGAARADRSMERLHEWRKQVKYLWHQLQLLEPLWPALIGELADQAHQLADYLGDEHDLAVLRSKVLTHSGALHTSSDRSGLLALINRCRAELQEKAFILGKRIYDEKPAAFSARFERYWHAWRDEHKVGNARAAA
jgi:CHAD domain-containing protein